jgi:nucleoid DNA-binding protein
MGKSIGRDYIIKQLQERGLSRRQATSILNNVIDYMNEALSKGEDVELPFGKLQVKKHSRSPKRMWALNKIVTTYKEPNTVVLVTEGQFK